MPRRTHRERFLRKSRKPTAAEIERRQAANDRMMFAARARRARRERAHDDEQGGATIGAKGDTPVVGKRVDGRQTRPVSVSDPVSEAPQFSTRGVPNAAKAQVGRHD